MSVLYLDASALVRLGALETGSSAMVEQANAANQLVTSVVGTVELARALSRAGLPGVAEGILARCTIVGVDESIAERATRLMPSTLRTLDAVHLATALEFASEIDTFVTYDCRQAAAATDAGLMVESPGQAGA